MIMPSSPLRRVSPWLPFIALLCPFHLPPSYTRTSHFYALGLVNVAPWAIRSHDGTTLFNVPEATRDTLFTTASSDESQTAAANSSGETVRAQNAAQAPSRLGTNKNQNSALRDKGIRMPPSQNAAQRRHGRIFSIQEPQDLLDFVVEDERLSVVKVFASWCKTCQVFDVRYRKLASQFGDKYDEKSGTEITQMGRVRFAEMQYDNPNNEEMCKLLNATKLPHIFIYKGSSGKITEFQCGPAKFQMLTDAVNKYADPIVQGNVIAEGEQEISQQFETLPVLNKDDVEELPQAGKTTIAAPPLSYGGDTVDDLKLQLVTLENEKVEMFEIMKAQIEHDKVYIQKLENGVETQRSMLEAKDGEISDMTINMEQQQLALKSKEKEVRTLTDNLKHQRAEAKNMTGEISIYECQVAQLTKEISKFEKKLSSVEQVSSDCKHSTQKNELEMICQIEELRKEKELYQEERNSLRKLTMLGGKRVVRRLRSLFASVRRRRSPHA